jgi:hypothetical protein
MQNEETEVIKKSGEKVRFSKEKLQNSLLRSGADAQTVAQIMDRVRDELYQGIPTRVIYRKALSMLVKKDRSVAAKYRLKNALQELGPSGFPFEEFVSALLVADGYTTQVGLTLPGVCVTHEVDVLAGKDGAFTPVECKFHNEPGLPCNVKVPLYIHARFNDIRAHWSAHHSPQTQLLPGWVVTNTRFTDDAKQYGQCVGLHLVGWDTPKKDSLKARIDQSGLYPITVSTLLTKLEKKALLDRKIVLCKQVLSDDFALQELGISPNRVQKILQEMNQLCPSIPHEERS